MLLEPRPEILASSIRERSTSVGIVPATGRSNRTNNDGHCGDKQSRMVRTVVISLDCIQG